MQIVKGFITQHEGAEPTLALNKNTSAADFSASLAAKNARRQADEALKPLAAYRAEELKEMRRNFYGFDPSYHVARYHFVSRTPNSWTPRHLARHRDLDWKIPQ